MPFHIESGAAEGYLRAFCEGHQASGQETKVQDSMALGKYRELFKWPYFSA
jgi:hypothetical protein